MRYSTLQHEVGILAAGEGRRLQIDHVDTPKPLIPVAGRPLIGWTFEALLKTGIHRATLVLHPRSRGVLPYAEETFPGLLITSLVQKTASTLESFCLVANRFKESKFLILMGDAVYPPHELERFLKACAKKKCDLAVAGSRQSINSSSLSFELDNRGRVHHLGKDGKGNFQTAGLYLCTSAFREDANRALAEDVPSFSRFLSLWAGGKRTIVVHEMKNTFDIDTLEDIKESELVLER